MFKCEKCNREFEKRQSYAGHMSSHNRGENYLFKRETEKSKLKKNKTEKYCKYCGKKCENGWKLGGHQTNCKLNPNLHTTRNKISRSLKGKTITIHTKEKISVKLKNAHKEGRAWNIGRSRWNNEMSYPEKFFLKVIENEFLDKNFRIEYSVGIYSIDFAWLDKKLAIEIDGEQHERFEQIIQRDLKKDSLLKSHGWKILRIKWKDMYSDTKNWIRIAFDFIHDGEA